MALQAASMPKRQRQEEEAEDGRRAAKLAPQVGRAVSLSDKIFAE